MPSAGPTMTLCRTVRRFSDLVYSKKLLIMQVSLSSELHMLTHQLDRLAQKSRRSRTLPSTPCDTRCGK